MKKLYVILLTLIISSSCATNKEMRTSGKELREEKKLAEQVAIRQAVESRRFIIKLDRLYFSYGGIINLVPRANYIIVDGDIAIVRAAYLGRQFEFKPIAGINIKGVTSSYEMKDNVSKGLYEIKMKVNNKSNTFDFYLDIGKNGNCSASLSNIRIDHVRYSGKIVPIKERTTNTYQNIISI